MGGEIHADPAQHVGELLPSQHPGPVFVYLSETSPETLDLAFVWPRNTGITPRSITEGVIIKNRACP